MNIKKGLLSLGIGIYSLLPVQAERDVYVRNTSELEQALQIDSSTEHIRINLANNIYEPLVPLSLSNQSFVGQTDLNLIENLKVSLDYEPITGANIKRPVELRDNSNLTNIIMDVPPRNTSIVFASTKDILENVNLDGIYIKRNNEELTGGLLFFTSGLENVSLTNSYISTGNDGAIFFSTSINSGEITLRNNIFHNNNIALWGNSTALFNARDNVFMSRDYNIEVARPPYELDFESNWWYRPVRDKKTGSIEYELLTNEEDIRETINVRQKQGTQNIRVYPFHSIPFQERTTSVDNWMYY